MLSALVFLMLRAVSQVGKNNQANKSFVGRGHHLSVATSVHDISAFVQVVINQLTKITTLKS